MIGTSSCDASKHIAPVGRRAIQTGCDATNTKPKSAGTRLQTTLWEQPMQTISSERNRTPGRTGDGPDRSNGGPFPHDIQVTLRQRRRPAGFPSASQTALPLAAAARLSPRAMRLVKQARLSLACRSSAIRRPCQQTSNNSNFLIHDALPVQALRESDQSPCQQLAHLVEPAGQIPDSSTPLCSDRARESIVLLSVKQNASSRLHYRGS
ncbi:hypothetical protein HPB51_011368 [Rhipicephalus microplus]|uniref:Uncharacterized protein n=1 Tax=Rhipicephalus microplus TaxID=6941 RepID=A0A9J6D9M6_RHIMP|nr:hypothetical protein HPB51_011368 [Rhipicephalus microplus]